MKLYCSYFITSELFKIEKKLSIIEIRMTSMYFSFFLLLTKKINYISWCFSHFSLSHLRTLSAFTLSFSSSDLPWPFALLYETRYKTLFRVKLCWPEKNKYHQYILDSSHLIKAPCLLILIFNMFVSDWHISLLFRPPSSREFCWPQFRGLPFYVCVKLEIRVQEAFSCVLVQRRVEKRRHENCSNEEFLWYGTWVSFFVSSVDMGSKS